jgi:hypothetical protein
MTTELEGEFEVEVSLSAMQALRTINSTQRLCSARTSGLLMVPAIGAWEPSGSETESLHPASTNAPISHVARMLTRGIRLIEQ